MITLALTIQEINLILQALGQSPYRQGDYIKEWNHTLPKPTDEQLLG
jgi:hypothetical protein